MIPPKRKQLNTSINVVNTHGKHEQCASLHRDTGSQESFERIAYTPIPKLISGCKVGASHDLDDLEENYG